GEEGRKFVLCDFGLAVKEYYPECKAANAEYCKDAYTLWYRPPEILFDVDYDVKSDIWAFGCTLVEIFTTEPLFNGKSIREQLRKIFGVLGPPPDHLYPDSDFIYPSKSTSKGTSASKSVIWDSLFRDDPILKDFISQTLVYDPLLRASSEILLKHELFRQI